MAISNLFLITSSSSSFRSIECSTSASSSLSTFGAFSCVFFSPFPLNHQLQSLMTPFLSLPACADPRLGHDHRSPARKGHQRPCASHPPPSVLHGELRPGKVFLFSPHLSLLTVRSSISPGQTGSTSHIVNRTLPSIHSSRSRHHQAPCPKSKINLFSPHFLLSFKSRTRTGDRMGEGGREKEKDVV